MKLTMGGSRDSCKGTRYSAIQRICMQSEAYKTCEGWATGDRDVAFPTNATKGVSPNKFTFIQVIKAFAALRTFEDGRLAHKQLIQTGCEFDVFVGSSLVDMYAKCGSIEDA